MGVRVCRLNEPAAPDMSGASRSPGAQQGRGAPAVLTFPTTCRCRRERSQHLLLSAHPSADQATDARTDAGIPKLSSSDGGRGVSDHAVIVSKVSEHVNMRRYF
jgi:hypothetical protein